MLPGENPKNQRTWLRCPDDSHVHDTVTAKLHAASTERNSVTDWAAGELDRRYCAGGPLTSDSTDRMQWEDFIGHAQSVLAQAGPDRPLPDLLSEMGVHSVDGLRSLLRMHSLDIAAGLLPVCEPSSEFVEACSAVLTRIDDPAYWV